MLTLVIRHSFAPLDYAAATITNTPCLALFKKNAYLESGH